MKEKRALVKKDKKAYGVVSLYAGETTNSGSGSCTNNGSTCNNSGSGSCTGTPKA